MDIRKLLSATSLSVLLVAGCATDSTVSKPQHAEQQPSETKSASLTLLAPAEGAVVPTLSDGQKAYLALPRAERVKKFADAKYRPKMRELGYYPKPLTLSWTNAAPEKAAPETPEGWAVFRKYQESEPGYVAPEETAAAEEAESEEES